MKLHTNTIQGSQKWLSLRSKSIGASEIASIIGLNNKRSAYMLWEEKLGLRTVEVTAAMQAGLDIEDEAREWFYKEYGIVVEPAVGTHDDETWALASFDGFSADPLNDPETILEIKNVKQEYHAMALAGKVPDLYLPQLYWQMYVSGLDKAYYLSYKRDNPAVVIVTRDDDFIAMAVPLCEEFWHCVMNLEPPPLTDMDYIDMTDNFELSEVGQLYKYHAAMEKNHKDKAADYKEKIKEIANGKNIKATGFKMSKYPIKGRVDYDTIMKQLLPDTNLNQYRKPSTTAYRITVE